MKSARKYLYSLAPILILYYPFGAYNLMSYFYVDSSSKITLPAGGSEFSYLNLKNVFFVITIIYFLIFLYKAFYRNSFSWKSWFKVMTLPILLYIGTVVCVFSPIWMNIGLYLSVARGDMVRADRLLKFGANPNRIFDLHGENEKQYTPLMVAVLNNKIEFVEKLLENGADKNFKNSAGKTALDIAKDKQLAPIIHLLEEK